MSSCLCARTWLRLGCNGCTTSLQVSMTHLLYVCILLFLVFVQLHREPLITISSHSLSFTIPVMAPQHGSTSMEHSCICGAGFTQEQHLTHHKYNCSTSIEILEWAFEKGLKHKHWPTAKHKRTESGASNVSRTHHQSLSSAQSRNQMSVDGWSRMTFKCPMSLRYVIFWSIENYFWQWYGLLFI